MKLYGKNPVLERIRRNPTSIRRLYLEKRTDLSEIVREAKGANLKFESVDRAWIRNKCLDGHTQGVVAEIENFNYASFNEILIECLNKSVIPVFLDRVTDPQNLGAVIRNLACLGGFALILPEYESSDVNETVLRVANGGENYIRIAKVANIATTIKKIKGKGIWIAGAVTEKGENISKVDFKFPLAIVIGSEGKGVRPGILRHLDIKVSLPMHGAAVSYNVTVATMLVCYEVNRRFRHCEERSDEAIS